MAVLLFVTFLLPVIIIVNTHAYVTSGLPSSTHQKWIEKMTEDICQTKVGDMTGDMIDSTQLLMQAWAQNPYQNRKEGKKCALKIEKLIKRLVDECGTGNLEAIPSIGSYNILLQGWTMAAFGEDPGVAAERAEEIFGVMLDEGMANAESVRLVLLGWRRSNDQNLCERIVKLLRVITEAYDYVVIGESNLSLALDTIAKSRCPNLGSYAEEVLTLAASNNNVILTEHYNLVLEAWRNSNDLSRMEEIVNHMEQMSGIYPDVTSYGLLIQAMCRNGLPEKATLIIAELMDRHGRNETKWTPNNLACNFVLDAWAKRGNFIQAKWLLERMEKPDVYSYTCVISACAKSRVHKEKAYIAATETFSEVERPNHVTYGTMLRACHFLLGRDDVNRQNEIIRVFNSCVRDGQVSHNVIMWLNQGAGAELSCKLLSGHTEHSIPEHWRRNVHEKHSYERFYR